MADWHYIEILENRLQRAQNHLRVLLANQSDESPIDLGDVLEPPPEIRPSRQDSGGSPESVGQDFYLENMIMPEDRATKDSHEEPDYHGRSSGFAFLHATKGFFDVTTSAASTSDPGHSSNGKKISELFDSPLPGKQALQSEGPLLHLLPSYNVTNEMTRNLFTKGCVLLRFIHQPTFDNNVSRIYLHEPLHFNDADHRFLPLLYAVLGLGFIFSKDQHKLYGCERAVWQGMRHFVAAQKMLDIHRSRDLVSLQTTICMIIFLQSAARTSTCYSYIGATVTTALQLGLHRKARNGVNPVEQEIRKRAFWVIQKTDTYIAATLGLPTLLSLEDVDQEMPLEVDDECITPQGIHHQLSNSTFSIQAASNAHTALQMIMAKAVKLLYPTKGPHSEPGQDSNTHIVSYAKIREVEQDLQQWQQGLPYTCEVVDRFPEYMPSLILQLRMAYAHVQIILYRPFLHYLTQMNHEGLLDERKSRCALACVRTSQGTMAVAGEMEMQGLVFAASWPCVYTIFLATVSLIFFTATTRIDGPDMFAVREDADKGMNLLSNLKCHDLGPKRCLAVVEMFRRSISSRIAPENDPQSSQREAQTVSSMTAVLPQSASTFSYPEHTRLDTLVWPSISDRNIERHPPITFADPATNPPSFNLYHSGSSTTTAPDFMSQPSSSQIPSSYGLYSEPSSIPNYAHSSQSIAGNMPTDFDAMSIPYMESFLPADEGWPLHQQEHQQEHQQDQRQPQQSNQGHQDTSTSLSQEDFAAANEIAAFMNTYPLNLTQPFNFSAAESP
ncbi:MAG: hypothetical protein M1830_001971 [Pleopsidium flavum]|nr:MAG: hypothetical protein M1830_001971 [Pleopsidium flavum]